MVLDYKTLKSVASGISYIEEDSGRFSKVADCLKSISERHKNIYFIDGIDLIPKNYHITVTDIFT